MINCASNIVENGAESFYTSNSNEVSKTKKIRDLVQDCEKTIEPIFIKSNFLYKGYE